MPEKKHSPLKLVFLAIIAGSVASSVFAGCGDGLVDQPASNRGSSASEPSGTSQSLQFSSGFDRVGLVTTTSQPTVEPPPVGDWPQLGGSSLRNNTPQTATLPSNWNVGKFDRRTGAWDKTTAKNVRWVANLGSQTYGNPVVAGDKVFVGTNNGSGYIDRFSAETDLGCLLAFDRATGEFLWQHSSEKLESGRVHDWPLQGICSTPLVEGNRLWFVTSRGEVRCLDTEGFRDSKDDGLAQPPEIVANPKEADVIWVYDMMAQLGVSQRNMAASSVTVLGDLLFVNTGNGTGESGEDLPAPDAPSFLCLDKSTGELVWADNSPGKNILHGQWSSPAVGVIDGVAQAIFAGGDGYIYSFQADRGVDGKPNLLWKFDCNPKESIWSIAGDGSRNYIIGTPVIDNKNVFVAVGADPELGEGEGCLWCISATLRGDVSPELAVRLEAGKQVPIEPKIPQAVDPDKGELAIANPNSAALWKYTGSDLDGDGKLGFEETLHRTLGTVVITGDLLYLVDLAGILHCVDVTNGKSGSPGLAKAHFTADLLAQTWSSPLVADGRLFVADEDGDIAIFSVGADGSEPIDEINLGTSLYTSPVAAGDTLYISGRDKLFAIGFPDDANKR
ncbi:MAG TPA: serine/threonine protein kinase [Planctomycetaceae bacterium]|nr:serine/threonine protein kinase [Planctomycetaceae bacterium]